MSSKPRRPWYSLSPANLLSLILFLLLFGAMGSFLAMLIAALRNDPA